MTKLLTGLIIFLIVELSGLLLAEDTDEQVVNGCSVHQFVSCHELAICVEEPGDPNSWQCVCPSDLEGDGLNGANNTGCGPKKCVFDEECHTRAFCNPDAVCECNQGYAGNGRTQCQDEDECTVFPCHTKARCENTDGSFTCTCKMEEGYVGDGFSCSHTCSVDYDCGNVTTERCVNDVCVCRNGYNRTEILCTDIDECAHNDTCHANATCTNTDGSYVCECKNGFEGDGYLCTELPRNCHEVLLADPSAKSGTHIIDPDGQGPLNATEVLCEIRPGLGITIVSSTYTGVFRFYKWRNEFTFDYELDIDSMKAIIATSGYCYQDMSYICNNGATLMDGDDYWLNGNNMPEENWGGASTAKMCACGELGFCVNRSSNCNCDGTLQKNEDIGRVLDKSKLPIRSVISNPSQGNGAVKILPLNCAPRPFDIPLDCHDAKFNDLYRIQKDGPQTLDFDGPEGPLDPVLVHCDMETYPHAGVTVIPHNFPYEINPAAPGNNIITYKVGVAHLLALTTRSEFCMQEASYECTNSRLLNNGNKRGYFTDAYGNVKDYWPGALGETNKCGCAITGTCESDDFGCNCDIMDNVTRKDFGIVTDRSDLPIGSVTLLDIGGSSHGYLRVSSLRCSGREFGIHATCQSYLDNGYTDSHTYLIDPDGPTKPEYVGNQPPFPVYCEMTGDPMYATTIVYHQYRYELTVTWSSAIVFAYIRAEIKQLTTLVDRAVSCTQTVRYTCRNAPLHDGVHSLVTWLSADGSVHSYFAGDGNQGKACSCGLTEPSLCEGGGECQCDMNDNVTRIDEGVLVKKEDLPMLQLQFSASAGQAGIEVGPLMCRDLFPNCADMKVFNSKFRLESENVVQNGDYVIDPDGPLGVTPFTVTCTGTQTEVPGTHPNDPTDGNPNSGVSRCYDINYMSNGKPVSPAQVQALVESSSYCAQELNLECQNAPLTGHSNFTTCDGVTQPGWAGSHGQDKCACGVTGSCAGGAEANCNCDLVDGEMREDGGWLVQKDRMAVCQVCVSLNSANSVPSDPKVRRVRPVVSNLYCDNKPLGQGSNCHELRDNGETKSGTRNIDPDGNGPTPAFPVACELQAFPPMGWTEIYPKEPEVPVPPDGVNHTVEYYVFSMEFVIKLIQKSGYCTQELLLECQNSALQLQGTFGWYSRNGAIQTSWAGGCTGPDCKCNIGGYEIDGGTIIDEDLLPITRVVLGSASGTRTLKVGPVKCFDLYQDCEDIRVHRAKTNPMKNNTYAIDPDAGGPTPPFAVTCDFKTETKLGITVVPVILPNQKYVFNAFEPGSKVVVVNYWETTYAQINALAEISGYCHQGMKYMCYKSPLINFMTPAQSFYTTYGGGRSNSFGVGGQSETTGCACVATKTCPVGHSCHCDEMGRMTTDYGAETNRTRLPITQLNFGGQGPDSSALYDLSDVRCSKYPFDLPEDCDDAHQRGYRTGEHLIWPASAVEPFHVRCDMDMIPDGGVTIIGNDGEDETNVTYGHTIKVKYHNAKDDQVDAVIKVSKFCYQPIIYKCRYTKMMSGQGFFHWKGGPQASVNMFMGAGNHFARECNCGRDGLCGGSEGKKHLAMLYRPCNCDAGDGELRADAGVFQVKSKLPVKEMFFGETGIPGSSGHVTLGRLFCSKKEFDFNECQHGFHDCHPNADCINKPGTYDCYCKPGWRGLGRPDVWANGRNCYDDDECAMNLCPWMSDCTNLPGSFNCSCRPGWIQTGKRKCQDIDECADGTHQCHANARCINLPGSYDCRCKRNYRGDGFTCEPLAVCACFGDPHCLTSDGKMVDYQGLCQYVMSRDRCDDLNSTPTFEVLTTHFRRPNIVARADAAWVKEVTINYDGKSILLMQGGEVRLDGIRVNTPVRRGNINIQRYGNGVIVFTQIGVEIRWSGNQNVEVYTPGQFANNTCGLCGNYNGNPDDDLEIGPECPEQAGNLTDNFNVFGNSWVVSAYAAENPQCAANCTDVPDSGVCTGEKGTSAKYHCDKIFDPNGKFKECFHEMEDVFQESYYQSCLYDICRLEGDIEIGICDFAESLMQSCLQQYGVEVNYRDEDFCEPECGDNMEYYGCGDGNQMTCMDHVLGQAPPSMGDGVCQPGCFCRPGFVLDGSECVPDDECGCVYEDLYLKIGEDVTGDGCVHRVVCQDSNTLVNETIECHVLATCTLKHGKYGCHCNEGYYGDGVTECVEDPCTSSPCAENENCVRHTDKPNGYQCECKMGFTGDCGNCTDIDECLTATSNCPANSRCINSVGSFECVCNQGYTMFAKKCEDEDECLLAALANETICPENSKCVNRIGRFECPCCAGYEETADGNCTVSAASPHAGQPKCCVCDMAICDQPGKVCGEDGKEYNSIKDMILSNCEKGLPPRRYIDVDYFGKCKGSCANVQCPKYQHCEKNQGTGKPTCVCDECTLEETESVVPVCTTKLDVYPNYCIFKKVQCITDSEADVLPDMSPCQGQGGASPVGPWGPWSPCSVTCGKGVSTRTRQAYTQAALENYELSVDTDCYEDPCPGGPCDVPGICDNIAEECVVTANNETVCECPNCENRGVDPVCGWVEGVNGGRPTTWPSACKVQQTACERDADDFEVMHDGDCGTEPLNCTRVPLVEYIRGGENDTYVSSVQVHLYACEGGCGHHKENCCQPSQTDEQVVELYNASATPTMIYKTVHIVRECQCLEMTAP